MGLQTLDDLHLVIFQAFDREDAHLYEFQIGGKKTMARKSVRYSIVEDVAALLEKPRLDEISALMTEFCESRPSRGYAKVCEQLLAELRATWLPWQRGKAQSWAAGLVHAAGMSNFLHDPSFEPHMKLRDIAPHFGVSPATMENKSREIRDAVNAFSLDSEKR